AERRRPPIDASRRCIGRILGQRRRDVGNEMKAGSARGPGRVSIHPGEKVRRLSTTTFFVFYIRQRRISESSLAGSVTPAFEEFALDCVVGEGDRGRVSGGRLGAAPEAQQKVGTDRVEQVILLEIQPFDDL